MTRGVNMNRNQLGLLLAAVAMTACAGAQTKEAPPPVAGAAPVANAAEAEPALKEIDPQALHQKMQAAGQVFVVDNNRPETYALAHVPGAVAMRPSDVTADKLPADKGAMLVFYCANEH